MRQKRLAVALKTTPSSCLKTANSIFRECDLQNLHLSKRPAQLSTRIYPSALEQTFHRTFCSILQLVSSFRFQISIHRYRQARVYPLTAGWRNATFTFLARLLQPTDTGPKCPKTRRTKDECYLKRKLPRHVQGLLKRRVPSYCGNCNEKSLC
jgi:hypothetical protein